MSNIRRIEEAFPPVALPEFRVGDTVDVHVLIREGDKERIQVFNGTVIRRRGGGFDATYTVRRLVQGQGVERVFPVHSPFVKKVEVKRAGKVRRSRLYYLRERTGKGTRLREIVDARRVGAAMPPSPAAEDAPAASAGE